MTRYARAAALLIAAMLVATFWTASPPPASAAGPTSEDTLALRVAKLEAQMEFLAEVADLPLQDPSKFPELIREIRAEQEELQTQAHVVAAITQLNNIRSQMELYQVQHLGNYPELERGWDQLTRPTNPQGAIYTKTDADGRNRRGLGPYLKIEPVNYFTQSSDVVPLGQAGPDAGWTYDAETGELRLVVPKAIAREYRFADWDIETY